MIFYPTADPTDLSLHAKGRTRWRWHDTLLIDTQNSIYHIAEIPAYILGWAV